MTKKKTIKENVTYFWWQTFRGKFNTAFYVGAWALVVIIFFPIWIWFGIIYLIIKKIGKSMCKKYGEKRTLEYEVKDEKEDSFY